MFLIDVLNFQGIGIMNDPVEDGICKSCFSDLVESADRGKLRAKDSGSPFMAGVDDFQKISGFRLRKAYQQPFVND